MSMKNSFDRSQIKVCMLTSGHSPFDDRIFHKEARTLAQAGYDVAIIAQHDKQEVVDGVRIIPLPKPANRYERMTKTNRKLFLLALKEKADVYHFHDPELIPIGLVLKFFGKKVIYDVHEDYTKQILDKVWLGTYILRKIVSVFFDLLERRSGRIFDKIIAVTDNIKCRYPAKRAITLRNLAVLELIDNAKPIARESGKPIIIYAGGLSQIRGIKEAIKAMEFIKDKAELWLLGKWESEEFEKECHNLEGWKYTRYIGFVPLGEVYGCLKVAHVGLHCVYRSERHMMALPIKVFEYAACGLPVVISDSEYWRKEFAEFALFVNPENYEDLANKIMSLLEDEELRLRLAKKGREFVERGHNWECESYKLLEVYETILKGGRKQ